MWTGVTNTRKMGYVPKRLHELFQIDIFLPAEWCYKLNITTQPAITHSSMYDNVEERLDNSRRTQSKQRASMINKSGLLYEFPYVPKSDFGDSVAATPGASADVHLDAIFKTSTSRVFDDA